MERPTKKRFRSASCGQSFSSVGQMEHHEKAHTGIQFHQCADCVHGFLTPCDLLNHILSHATQAHHNCSSCGKQCNVASSKRPAQLPTLRRRPKSGAQFECEFCSKGFKYISQLKLHLMTHTGEKPYQCEVCRKNYRSKRSLEKHLLSHDPSEYVSQTAEADEQTDDDTRVHSSSIRAQLARRADRKTRGRLPRECTICGKSFRHSGHLKAHMRTHTGEKPHVCPVCGKRCSQASNLRSHMRQHEDDKPHQCQFCKEQFRSASMLKAHMYTHQTIAYGLNGETEVLENGDLAGEGTSQQLGTEVDWFAANDVKTHNMTDSMETHTNTNVNETFEVYISDAEVPSEASSYGGDFDTADPDWSIDDDIKTQNDTKTTKTPVRSGSRATRLSTEVDRTITPNLVAQNLSQTNENPTETSQEAELTAEGDGEETKKKLYKCKVCSKVFKHIGHYKRHMRCHQSKADGNAGESLSELDTSGGEKTPKKAQPGQKRHVCKVCGKGFSYRCLVKTHMLNHSNEKPHVCPVCGKGCKHASTLKHHVKTHERAFQCDVCSQGFKSEERLKTHMLKHTAAVTDAFVEAVGLGGPEVEVQNEGEVDETVIDSETGFSAKGNVTVTESGEQRHECPICTKQFKFSSALNVHMRTHTGEQPFQCPVCSKKYKSSSHLKTHLLIHTGERPYVCPDCGKGFPSTARLKSHMVSHSSVKPYMCSMCGKGYTSVTYLKAHMQFHSGQKPYECSVCGKGFAVSNNLKMHMRIHTGEKPFLCSYCGKAYSLKGNLKEHMIRHTGENPHVCTTCGRGFPTASHLKIHIRGHTGEKPYQCQICGKSYIMSSHLKDHMTCHTTETPHVCSVCGKGFRLPKALKKHELIHQVDKPFRCSECGKGFCSPYHLKVHMSNHTGDRPHACTMCDKRYVTRDSLNVHMKTHTPTLTPLQPAADTMPHYSQYGTMPYPPGSAPMPYLPR